MDSYRYAKIPLETFVSDSQYMDKDQGFTYSESYPLSGMKVHLRFASHLLVRGQTVDTECVLLAVRYEGASANCPHRPFFVIAILESS